MITYQDGPIRLYKRLKDVVRQRNGMLEWCADNQIMLTTTDNDAGRSYFNGMLRRAEKKAGRKLTERELYKGLDHPDDRGLRHKIAQDGSFTTNTIEDNPYAHLAHDEESNPGNVMSREAYKEHCRRQYRQLAEEWEDNQEREAADQERRASPEWQKRYRSACEQHLLAYYNPHLSTVELREAAELKRIAEFGTVAEFNEKQTQIHTREKLKQAERTAAAAQVLAEAESDLADFGADNVKAMRDHIAEKLAEEKSNDEPEAQAEVSTNESD